MSAWQPRRFWQNARVEPAAGGYMVRLDARPLKTPAKALLVLPTAAMAEAVAAEWQAQTGVIKPETMPVTRSANAAIDKIASQFAEVAGLIAAYAGSDLLCYRAPGPAALVARQVQAWDPLLAWAAAALAAPLNVTVGITPVAQPADSLARLAGRVQACTPFELAALHDLVTISGSLVLGLAVVDGRADAATIWQLSRIDEDWQIAQWGQDAEAGESAALRRAALIHAEQFLGLCR